ncbi:2OG-Fe(II) oxygenase superfamily protein [Tistlia consotensis]|uniref:2OG-Fe(II) oxygenase superfamily protein n=1 Tax=Tistlia consotensis USBA 355 TaxID=560819 RepID=A0A1Y6BG77_9PROT|nr:2OG-Fe(II) oxygenase [Tistlia consotensis]SME99941.1 2OG-Fe(II) oxygenase superfamily protein [Tistlia consotensis USBA 355]SNR76511.1 2OG-Fe(II) oxygenase superfamily protein [Tistlia consotensis]
MDLIDLNAIAATPVATEPFPHFVATPVLDDLTVARINRDFPAIAKPGLFPVSELDCRGAFSRLIEAVRDPRLESLLARKFGAPIEGKPLMVTVRGHCQAKDGRIHTDTRSKLVTCLLYLNEDWRQDGGRLRLLRGPDDIEDKVAEVPPTAGTLVAFRRTSNSYHGHKPFVGPRRYVMFNWLTDEAAYLREVSRHRLSARIKRVMAR